MNLEVGLLETIQNRQDLIRSKYKAKIKLNNLQQNIRLIWWTKERWLKVKNKKKLYQITKLKKFQTTLKQPKLGLISNKQIDLWLPKVYNKNLRNKIVHHQAR